ncbi:hypothetical protein [Enterococcus avium]|nr:hypothetical protein [Enterococcus avium]
MKKVIRLFLFSLVICISTPIAELNKSKVKQVYHFISLVIKIKRYQWKR